MTDSRQRVEAPITKHLEGLVQKGVPPASRTGLFSTPKFSFCDGQPVYLLSRGANQRNYGQLKRGSDIVKTDENPTHDRACIGAAFLRGG
jgi:hypothetical protein